MIEDIIRALMALGCIPQPQIDLVGNVLLELKMTDELADEETVTAFNTLQSLLFQSDQDNLTIWSSVQDTLFNTVVTRIENYGVFLDSDTLEINKLTTLYQILFGLNNLEFYEDKQTLKAIVETENDDRLCLINLLKEVNSQLPEDVEEMIIHVNPVLIQNLMELLIQNEVEVEVVEDVEEITSEERTLLEQRLKILTHKDFFPYIDKEIGALLGTKPLSIELCNFLTLQGRKVADMTASEYTWITIAWLCQNGGIDKLFEQWGRCFTEEVQRVNTQTRIQILLDRFKEV